LNFTPNLGQWPESFDFKCKLPTGGCFIQENELYFNCYHPEDLRERHLNQSRKKNQKLRAHAFKLSILDHNEEAYIQKQQESASYTNYYLGNDPLKWKSKVHDYKELVYKNIYKGVDLHLYSEENKLKFDWVLDAGIDPKTIVFKYEGIDGLSLSKEGNLELRTNVGTIQDEAPIAYQIINNKIEYVDVKYNLDGTRISFKLGNYNKDYPLTIDPALIFSTYTGSASENWGYTATFDNDGNVYSGGIDYSTGFPVSLGAYQSNQNSDGLADISIIKYNEDGTQRLWASYLGGIGSDAPHSMIVNSQNELLIYGSTSSADFPISTNAFDQTFGGGNPAFENLTYLNGSDIIVSKFSEDGTDLRASTFFGGDQNDGLIEDGSNLLLIYGDESRGEIILDNEDNVYIGSSTYSSNLASNGFQQTHGGDLDGVVAKFNSSLSNLIFCTYVGGSGADAVCSIDVNSKYELYICGGTLSNSSEASPFPTTSGVIMETSNDTDPDAFVSRISKNGNTLIASTLWGTDEVDQAYFIRTNKFDEPHIYGITENVSDQLHINAIYVNPGSGQFISKFTANLETVHWSTVFGSGRAGAELSPSAFAVDICNRIYTSGWGTTWHNGSIATNWGTHGFEATNGSVTDGQDFYIGVFRDDMSALEFATFFGEQKYVGCLGSGRDHVDGGTSRFDKKGNIYQSVCASCGGCQQFPTKPNPGAWSTSNNSPSCNNAVFKYNVAFDYAVADFTRPEAACAPINLQLDNSSRGLSWEWQVNGETSNDSIPNFDFTQAGIYDIQLVVTDSGSCNISDTLTHQFQVLKDTLYSMPDQLICGDSSFQMGLLPNTNPNISYSWQPSNGLADTSISNPFVQLDTTRTYLLLISNGICTDSIYQHIELGTHNFDINLNDTFIICNADSLLLDYETADSIISILCIDLFSTDTLNSLITDSSIHIPAVQYGPIVFEVEGENCKTYDTLKLISDTLVAEQVFFYPACDGDLVVLHSKHNGPMVKMGFVWIVFHQGLTNLK
jgi:hypothetical protein